MIDPATSNDNRNSTEKTYNVECIHKLFEERVVEFPNNAAVSLNGFKLSYAELNDKANNIAHLLIRLGVKPNDFVGIYAERSFELIAGMLGILKTGAAYVPLS